jgi:hypothetical protein
VQVAPRRHLEIADGAEIVFERRQYAGQADRGMRAVVEGQQQQFQMRGRAVFGGRGNAGNRRQHFLGDVAYDLLDLAAAVRCKQGREAGVLEVAAEQGRNPRAGNAKRVAGVVVVGQHEDVAEQVAHRIGLDLAAVWRPRVAALGIPIGEELAT